MKKKLNLNKLSVKSFVTQESMQQTDKLKGGTPGDTFVACGPSDNPLCTFDECFTKGRGCTRYQVC